jgi:hypothetical protein
VHSADADIGTPILLAMWSKVGQRQALAADREWQEVNRVDLLAARKRAQGSESRWSATMLTWVEQSLSEAKRLQPTESNWRCIQVVCYQLVCSFHSS